jgi:hypothetical protein
LFYAHARDIRTGGFGTPIEIDTVEETGGHIRNLDLYVDGAGAAHLLYLKRPHQYGFIRDKYFPGQPMTVHLEYAVVKGDRVVLRKTLAQTPQGPAGLEPSFGRFHIGSAGALYVIVAGTGIEGQQRAFGNYLARVPPDRGKPGFERITLQHAFRNFFTNTPRGGSKPSDVIDIFGIADDGPNLRYARIRIRDGRD